MLPPDRLLTALIEVSCDTSDETVSGESRVLYKLHNITQLYLQDDTTVAKSIHSIDNSGMAKVSNFKYTSLTGNLYGSFCKMQ